MIILVNIEITIIQAIIYEFDNIYSAFLSEKNTLWLTDKEKNTHNIEVENIVIMVLQ